MWASAADGNFNIYEDTESEPLERGTEIRIHLKEDASEYLEEDKLKVLFGSRQKANEWCQLGSFQV